MIEKAIMTEKDLAIEIEALRTEVTRLQEELSQAREKEAFYTTTRRAMIFMLEDLNKSSVAVALAKKEWEDTFNAITGPLFIHDSDFRIVLANSAYAKYAGSADFVGRPYYEIFPRMEGPLESCLHAVKGGKDAPEAEEEDIEVPQLNMIFRGRQYPIKDASGRYSHSIHILHDVTRLKTAEQELKTEVSVTSGLLSIAEATTRTRDMDSLLGHAVEASARILRANACLSYLYDSATGLFNPQQSFGLSPAELPSSRSGVINADTWFIKEALASETASVVHAPFNRTQPAARSLLFLERAATLMVLPFARKGGASGIFIYLFAQKRELQEKDQRLIAGIINQVSSAVEEARLYRESVDKAIDLSRRIETIKVMREIDRSILSTLETSEIIETVTMLLARLIACDKVTVFMADRTRGGFVFQAGFGIDLPKGWFCPFSETTATEVLEGFHIQYAANLMEEKTLLPFETRLADSGFLSHIRLPIMVKGEAIPLMARILTVADTVDAMGADRPYRKGRPMEVIISELKRCSGTQFDPELVEVFLGTQKA